MIPHPPRRPTASPLWTIVIVLALTGCAMGPAGVPPTYRAESYDAPEQGIEYPAEPPPELDTAPMEDLELARARELGLQRNHSLAAAQATVESAVARIAEARAAFLPTVGGQMRRTFNREAREIEFAPGETTNVTALDEWAGSAELSISLFAFGRDWEALQAARANAATQVLDERSVKQELLFLITESWYGIHEAMAQEEVARDALAAAERQLQDAENVFAAGRTTRDAVLTARVNMLGSKQTLLVAQNAVINARRILNTLLSRDLDAPITLAAAPTFEPVILDAALLKGLGRQHNPDLLAFRTRREVLERTRESVERSLLPELRGLGSVTYSDFRDFGGYSTNFAANFIVDWRPIQGGLRLGQLDQIHADLIALREQEIQSILDLDLAIQRTILEVSEIESQHIVAAEAVGSAEENYRIISDRFRAGRTTSREVLDAQTTMSNSRFLLNQARYGHRILLGRLEQLAGVAQESWVVWSP